MGDLWMQFETLDVLQQSAVVGLLVTGLVGLLKKFWPWFNASGGGVKFWSAVTMAGVTGYNRGGWAGVAVAIALALSAYDVSKNVTKALAQRKRGA